MNILVRADSSYKIGLGHIMRDLVLVKKYKNSRVIFAVRELKGNINYKIKEAGYEALTLKSNDFEELQSIIEKFDINMLILDHYEIDYEYEWRIKEKNPGLKLMVIDDLYRKHYCDILLNHNIYADKNKYIGLVPDFCEIRCGKKYTLIRDEFINAKKSLKYENERFTVFLAMGGADTANFNVKILNVLAKMDVHVNVVTTLANKNIETLKTYSEGKDWITLYIDAENIARIMLNSDLAIVTPSVILNEVFYLGLPFIAIKTADNQKEMVEFLKKNNYYILESFSEKMLLDILRREYEKKYIDSNDKKLEYK